MSKPVVIEIVEIRSLLRGADATRAAQNLRAYMAGVKIMRTPLRGKVQ
jgi:hypothetical protein